MSGGSFDYACARVDLFVEELRVKLADPDYEWTQPTDKILREIEQVTGLTARLMREVEWLYSGDTGEDSFMQRVTQIIEEVESAQAR